MQDDFGPEIVLRVYEPKEAMNGILVIDNTKKGPGKGGIRLVKGITEEEVSRLARAMTWKNALAKIPFGGAKSGISLNNQNKEALIRSFAKKIIEFVPEKYVAGPDMGVSEKEIAFFIDEISKNKGKEKGLRSATGKPASMGGLPHELGSTGFGVAKSTLAVLELLGKKPTNSTVAIEGFGNVGTFTARFLSQAGMKVIAVSDSKGCIYSEEGIEVEELIKIKAQTGAVCSYSKATRKKCSVSASEDLFALPVDVLIPGARPDAINDLNKAKVKAKIIVEAANIPISYEIEKEFWKKGIIFVPDIIANAGGVISSYVEWIGGSKQEMFSLVEKTISENTNKILGTAIDSKKNPRELALEEAKELLIQ